MAETKQTGGVKPGGGVWAHVIETGILAAVLTWIFVPAAHATHIPYWVLALAELILAAAVIASVLVATSSTVIAAYLAMWGLLIPVWTLLAGWLGYTSRYLVAALAVSVLALIPRGGHIFLAEAAHRKEQEDKRLAIDANQAKIGWARTFALLGIEGVQVADIVPTRAGEDIHLRLPRKGHVTFSTLREAQDRIETSRKMKRGSIRFSEGTNADEVIMHVTVREVLQESLPFPLGWLEEPQPSRTINDPFEAGLGESGDVIMITFRELAALVLGVRRSGKSNALNVLIAQLTRCTDTLVFMIDMKGGQAASAWLVPWINGETERPALDWVATTRDEAKIMLDTLLLWIDVRARNNVGKEKVIPSPRKPAIVLIVDEVSEVFGQNGPKVEMGQASNAVLAALGDRLVSLGGSAAIDPIYATQRGTVTKIGSGDLKSQCELRIGLGAVSTSDAQYIFNDYRAAQLLTRLSRVKGAGLMELGEVSEPMKWFRIDPEAGDVAKIARYVGDWRPQVEQELLDAAGPAYSERWTGGEHTGRRGQDYITQIRRGTLPADPDQEFFAITEQLGNIEPHVNPARKLAREIVDKAGVMGESPYSVTKQLAQAGYKVRRETVNRWLSDDEKDGRLTVKNPGHPTQCRYIRKRGLTGLPPTGTGDA